MCKQFNTNCKQVDNEDTLRADDDLWQNIRQGDHEAFVMLFKKYYQPLYRFSGRLVWDAQAAENIVQDLFVTLWIQKNHLKITSGLKSYLYQAVKNRALTHLKKARRMGSLINPLAIKSGTAASPEETYLNKELYTAVHQAIAKLPNKCRHIYLMKRYDNLAYAEIAETLNISLNTVKTQLQRALKSLEKQLASYLK
jgi:RNA polymerase sigma-70 factor (family 1)